MYLNIENGCVKFATKDYDKTSMTLVKCDEEEVVLTHRWETGVVIKYDHYQNCCENNYIDFEPLDMFIGKQLWSVEANADGTGLIWRFGAKESVETPARSEQNGYYTYNCNAVFCVDGRNIAIIPLNGEIVDTSGGW